MKNNNVKIQFEEPYTETEVYGITYSFEDWINNLEESKELYNRVNEKLLTSGEFIEYVKNAKGFMTQPVAKNGTEILNARSYKFKSVEDLKELDLDRTYVYKIIDASGNRTILKDGEEIIDILKDGKIPEDRLEYRERYIIRYAELPA